MREANVQWGVEAPRHASAFWEAVDVSNARSGHALSPQLFSHRFERGTWHVQARAGADAGARHEGGGRGAALARPALPGREVSAAQARQQRVAVTVIPPGDL